MTDNNNLVHLTADIVSAHVSNNNVSASDIPSLIHAVHAAFSALGEDVKPAQEDLKPAVSIRSSVKPDYIVCLEDGKKLQMLKRYLRTSYDMSPEDYRAKWGLPRDYPMVAANYAARRRELAKQSGLGRKPAQLSPKKSKAASNAHPATKGSQAMRNAKPAAESSRSAPSAQAPQPRRRGRPAKT